ncbi:Imm58 family immunity protein [Ralstonia pseudosolanacearum]
MARRVYATTPKIVVKKEGNIIWFDEVRFNFDEGRLKSIGDK